MTPFFRCAECGDHVKATEYGECAYCGGDVEIIDGEAQMIDIESMDRDALIAEIRRLRGENKMLYQMVDDAIAMAAHRRIGLLGPDAREHRRCPCGGKPVVMGPITKKYWVECEDCQCGTDFCNTPEEAWAAWDRREGEEISKYQRVEGE